MWLHYVFVDHKFPKCLNIFFLSSRKRQTTVRSFKIKRSWSGDASSTANTLVSSQVRTNCHPFIHSFLNLFILYDLMQKYLLSQLPCKSKVLKKLIFVCTTEAKACSITSLLSSSPLQPFQGCTNVCIPLVLVPQPACKIFSSPCVFFLFTILCE